MSLHLLLTISTGFGNDVTDSVLKQWLLIEMMSSALCLTTLEVPSFIVEVFLECDDDWKYGFSRANNSYFRLGRAANCPDFIISSPPWRGSTRRCRGDCKPSDFQSSNIQCLLTSCQCYRLVIRKKPMLPLLCWTNSVGNTTPNLLWYTHRLSGKPPEQPLRRRINIVTHCTRHFYQQLSEVSSQSN